MTPKNKKASELIEILETLIEMYGDKYVFHGGGDYPDCVNGIEYIDHNKNPYIPKDSFEIY